MDNTKSNPIRSLGAGGTANWILVALGFVLLATAIFWSQMITRLPPEEEQEQELISQSAFETATGVRIVRVALTAGGGMIDLRYQVIDPQKALIIHDEGNFPAIVDEASGAIINTPWMNHSHSGEYQAGVTYYTLMMNSGGVLSRGSKVTVVL